MGGESVASTEINRKATKSVNKADFNKTKYRTIGEQPKNTMYKRINLDSMFHEQLKYNNRHFSSL